MRRFPLFLVAIALLAGAGSPVQAWTPTSPDPASVAAFGGSNTDEGTGIATDGAGNSYVIGTFRLTADFDPGPGTTNITASTYLDSSSNSIFSNTDGFISKFNGSGNLVWVKTLGGIGDPSGVTMAAVAVDSSGILYVTGSFNGTVDLDLDSGTPSAETATSRDSFVLKIDSNGNLIWKSIFVGTNQSQSKTRSLAIDKSGNVVTAGEFTGTIDFDPGQGTSALVTSNGQDAFISKIDATGQFEWAKPVTSSVSEIITSVKVDSSDNVLASGVFQLTVDFDPGSGTNNLTSAGQFDTFVLKLDSVGNFVWARSMGGTSGEDVYSLAIDSNDAVIIAGTLQGSGDFDPGAGTSTLTTAGGPDGYMVKLDSAGTFVWAERFGGTSDDEIYSISIDGSGNVFATGYFGSPADFDPGTGTSNLVVNSYGIFVLKVNSAGLFQWARALGGDSFDQGNAIAADVAGNTYTTGAFNGTSDFDPGAGTANLTSVSFFNDVFLARLDPTGSATIDVTSPTATWSSAASTSTSRTITLTVTFSEAVSGITAADFTNTGTATGCVFTPSASSTTTSISVSLSCSSDGTVIPQLLTNAVTDTSGNNGPSSAVTGTAITITTTSGSTPTASSPTPSAPTTTTVAPSAAQPTPTTTSTTVPQTKKVTKSALPSTGSSSTSMIVWAAVLVGCGAILVRRQRRVK